MTLTAHLSIDDLGLVATDPAAKQTGPDADDPWPLGKDRQPSRDPAFPGDFLARMHDAGVPYHRLVSWLSVYAFYRKPDMHQAIGWNRYEIDETNMPLPTRLGLTRDPGEPERDHLFRAGRQVPVFVQPKIQPTPRLRRREHKHASLFYDPKTATRPPTIEVQQAMTFSPVTQDRAVLVERGQCPRSVLALLARDPSPLIREAVAWHRKTDAAIFTRFGPTPDAPGHIETDPQVITTLLGKHRCPASVKALFAD